jgi:membrane-associated phospholipid phosphatase
MKLTKRHTLELTIACLLAFSPALMNPAYASDPIEQAGNALLIALPASAVAAALYNRDFPGLWEYGLSVLLNESVTFGLKNTVHELRPDRSDRLSFPSGHSSTTFTAAGFLMKRYGWQIGVPALALATFTAYSRVEANKHFIHDVAAGAALGFISSYIFTKPFHGVTITPVSDGKSIGLKATGTF